MKRIPRQVPATRGRRTKGAAATQTDAHDWPAACAEARGGLSAPAAALLDRLQGERMLRLERGLLSEATGIELAMQLICESVSFTDAAERDDRTERA
jgi:hypothetical protein